jgi:polyhydroxyalkanoate synthase
MADYLRDGLLTAMDVIKDITGSRQANIASLCLGGTLTAVLLGDLARTKAGRGRVRSATLLNTLVDFSEPGDLGCFVDEASLARLEQKMAKEGYLPAEDMAGTFNMLRANDLIWRYVQSNWLMGEEPPAFDLLAWNDDKTRMPARMHSEYLRWCYIENRLARGTFTIDGKALALGEVTSDVYVVAAIEDHITPWKGGYLTTGLFGGPLRFERSHRRCGEPTGRQAELLDERSVGGVRRRVARGRDGYEGVVVGGLDRVDRRSGRPTSQAGGDRQHGLPADLRCAGGVRAQDRLTCAIY